MVFFERDVHYYAWHRDLPAPDFLDLQLYPDWESVLSLARRHVEGADVVIVTSYCSDGIAATDLAVSSSRALKVFYDMDTPVTLARLGMGESLSYIGPDGLRDFDLVLSYTGGPVLQELRDRLNARRVEPLYGSVDPAFHRKGHTDERFRADLSYLGTYAEDRQAAVESLFLEPARQRPEARFIIAGSQYPDSFPQLPNLSFQDHLVPADHPAFYTSSRLTLNVTRQTMADNGYCPSGRLFEATACGAAVLSDWWPGFEEFFQPGEEVLIATTTESALAALDLSDGELERIAKAGRERTLADHTAEARAIQLERLLSSAHPSSGETLSPVRMDLGRSYGDKKVCWGIIPAAGAGTRIQPLAFSKELLPVGGRLDGSTERPKAVSEYLVERMVTGGANRLCFVISPGKSDILEYYTGSYPDADFLYVVQPRPSGLCDALFRAAPLIPPGDTVLIGLPDTVWFPEDAFRALDDGCLSFLLFPVENPERFDAVVIDDDGRVLEIQVKSEQPKTTWIWGAFKMPAFIFHELHALWLARERVDEFVGTLVNAYIAQGGSASAVRAGRTYMDVGTLEGFKRAIDLLTNNREPAAPRPSADSKLARELPPAHEMQP